MELKLLDFLDLDQDASLDEVLKKIHLKRLKSEIPKFVEGYLEKKFIETDDVRFFNELLWFDNKTDQLQRSIDHFNLNYSNSKYRYIFDEDLKYCLDIQDSNAQVNKSYLKNNSIALIGNPFQFIFAYKKFSKLNVDIDVVNIMYHPSKVYRLLFFNPLISLFYKFYFRHGYKQIKVQNKKDLRKINIGKEYDVGFHKLSFIISDNIISKFKKGLINDHWGALPLFKGRSTLLYSKLFGANLTITNHLISKEIDSGKILMFTNIKTKSIKKEIYFGLANRIFKSICLLCNDEFIELDNKQGHVFYEMHPWLVNKMKK
ncbi:hypothetical protein [Psychroserpens sp. MEBiC05023]